MEQQKEKGDQLQKYKEEMGSLHLREQGSSAKEKSKEADLSVQRKIVLILKRFEKQEQSTQQIRIFSKLENQRERGKVQKQVQNQNEYSQLSFEQLSRQFTELFIINQVREVSLDKVAQLLSNQIYLFFYLCKQVDISRQLFNLQYNIILIDIERRKTYDIINIMDSLDLIVKKDKNNILWQGIPYFEKLLVKLLEQIQNENLRKNQFVSRHQVQDKQLRYLSRGFIKLFLEKKRTLTLEQAVNLLETKRQLTESSDIENDSKSNKQIKTKIRRLYDISNVFKSIGIIKKVKIENNKPAYEWIGVKGLVSTFQEIQSMNCFQKIYYLKRYEQQMLRQYQNAMLAKLIQNRIYKKQLLLQNSFKRNILIQHHNMNLFQYFSQNQHQLFQMADPLTKKVKK